MKYSMKQLGLLALLTLAGCASTPSNYYTLMSVGGDQVVSSAAKPMGAYVLGEVVVPADVDQIPLMVQERDGRLLMLEYDRWASPLSGQIQNALSKGLTQKLGFPPEQNLNLAINDKRHTRVRVAVRSFEMLAGQYADMSVVWQISFAGSEKTLSCFAQLRETVNPGVSELVLAQQKNVGKLADLISIGLQTQAVPSSAVCKTL